MIRKRRLFKKVQAFCEEQVPWDCLRFVIVVFPDHTHFLFLRYLLVLFWYAEFEKSMLAN